MPRVEMIASIAALQERFNQDHLSALGDSDLGA
jgi:hypothetical protein